MTTAVRRYFCLVLLLAGGNAFAAAPEDTLASQCAALAGFRIPGSSLEIQKAQRQVATVTTPAHCKVEGTLEPHTGRDNKPYAIGFAVALPEQWNGRMLFQGGGGLNGSVNAPLGAGAAGDRSALARGFAVVRTPDGQAIRDAARLVAALDWLWAAGAGFGLPMGFLLPVGQWAMGFHVYLKHGDTLWDRTTRAEVRHGAVSGVGIAAAALLDARCWMLDFRRPRFARD
jgi:hypothetical protein